MIDVKTTVELFSEEWQCVAPRRRQEGVWTTWTLQLYQLWVYRVCALKSQRVIRIPTEALGGF